MVTSRSNSTPHYVQALPSGQYLCDDNCLQWKSSKICSHVIAVSDRNGELGLFLDWYNGTNQQPNITTLSMQGLPKGRGRKGGVPKRQRSKTSVPCDAVVPRPATCTPSTSSTVVPGTADTTINASQSASQISNVASPFGSLLTQNITVHPPIVSPNTNPFFLRAIQGNIRMCQGCRTSLRNSDGSIPLPPYDLAVARFEKRVYRDKNGTLCTPQREQAVHYHFKQACINVACPDFVPSSLVIPEDTARILNATHKEYLRLIFKLTI